MKFLRTIERLLLEFYTNPGTMMGSIALTLLLLVVLSFDLPSIIAQPLMSLLIALWLLLTYAYNVAKQRSKTLKTFVSWASLLGLTVLNMMFLIAPDLEPAAFGWLRLLLGIVWLLMPSDDDRGGPRRRLKELKEEETLRQRRARMGLAPQTITLTSD